MSSETRKTASQINNVITLQRQLCFCKCRVGGGMFVWLAGWPFYLIFLRLQQPAIELGPLSLAYIIYWMPNKEAKNMMGIMYLNCNYFTTIAFV